MIMDEFSSDSNISFDYDCGASNVIIRVNDDEKGKLDGGTSGTWHLDMTPGFYMITITANTEDANTAEGAIFSNM